jgi:allantoinase
VVIASRLRARCRCDGSALALHPFVIGQPSRYPYLEKALAYIADHDGVWLTTSDEIAEHYAATTAAR